MSAEFHDFYTKEGITYEVIAPYTPHHNDTAKRENKTILYIARSMLKTKDFAKEILGRGGFNCSVYSQQKSYKEIG